MGTGMDFMPNVVLKYNKWAQDVKMRSQAVGLMTYTYRLHIEKITWAM